MALIFKLWISGQAFIFLVVILFTRDALFLRKVVGSLRKTCTVTDGVSVVVLIKKCSSSHVFFYIPPLPGPWWARLATMITPLIRLLFDHGIALPNHHKVVFPVSQSLPVARASLTKTFVDWKTDHILGTGSRYERARFSNVSSEQGIKNLGCHTGVWARARESKGIASSCFRRFARISGEKTTVFQSKHLARGRL